jgi:ABC-type phosphate transport system substrate-binding protein
MLWLGLASPSTASNDEFKITVHPANPVSSVDREFLRAAFLRKATNWSDGKAIRPIGLAKRFRAHDRFAQDVLGKTPAQLRSYWLQRIFSGTDVPPPDADSPAAAIAYVLANPGAVAYLPIDADPGAAKVITLR